MRLQPTTRGFWAPRWWQNPACLLEGFSKLERVPLVSDWFEWFYHRDKGMTGYAFGVDRLHQVARSAAAALGVEIFGGDAIIRRDGEPVIIDLNAWPSYAKFRDKAAQAIADYLAHRFHRGPRAVI